MSLRSLLLFIIVGLGGFIAAPFSTVLINELLNLPALNSNWLKIPGLILIAVGVILFIHCSSIFKKTGRGTPVPIEPPKNLVQNNIYKYTRNPIYWGYFSIILGEALFFGHFLLFLYFLAFVLLVNLFVIFYEEPQLKQRFGQVYLDYCQKVPRWL